MRNHSLSAYLKDEADLSLVGDVATSIGLAVTKVEGGKAEICEDSKTWVIPPQIILIDLADEADVIGALEEIAESGPDTEISVIVVGSTNDTRLSRRLQQLGVVDYLLKPLARNDLVEALTQAMQKGEGKGAAVRPHRLVTVTSPQGGTGTSLVAAACAAEYARQGYKTLLLDLDFCSGTQQHLHGGDVSEGYRSAIQEPSRIDNTYLARIINKVGSSGNLYVLSEPGEIATPPTVSDLNAFLALLTSAFEMVVVDLPRYTSWGRQVLPLSSRIFCLAQPTLAGVNYALNFSKAESKSLISDSLIFIINDVNGAKNEGIKLDDFSKRINHAFLSLPHDPVTVYRQARNDEIILNSGKLKKKIAKVFETLPTGIENEKPKDGAAQKGQSSLIASFIKWINT